MKPRSYSVIIDEFPLSAVKRPLWAYAALLAGVVLTFWVLMQPLLVHGQSRQSNKLTASPATTRQPEPSAVVMTAPAEPAPDARMSEGQRQKMREQIIESSRAPVPATGSTNSSVNKANGKH